MSYLNNRVLDLGLTTLIAETTRLTILAAAPTDYVSATTPALGAKPGVTVVGPQNAASGRMAVVGPISDGSVSVAGTAAFWALVDDSGSRLLASAPLSDPLPVAVGNAFTLTSFNITLPGVAA